MAFCVRSLRSLIKKIQRKRNLRAQGRFYSCFLWPPLKLKLKLFLRGKSNKICKEMRKKEKLMQFTGYMLFKLKDFFYRRKSEWWKSEWESYKGEWKIERVISFNKLRYFCLSLFYHDSAKRKSKHCAR